MLSKRNRMLTVVAYFTSFVTAVVVGVDLARDGAPGREVFLLSVSAWIGGISFLLLLQDRIRQ